MSAHGKEPSLSFSEEASSQAKDAPSTASSNRSSSPAKTPQPKWYHKLSRKGELSKEKFKDASLSDEERWKDWHKKMDKNQHEGYVGQSRGNPFGH